MKVSKKVEYALLGIGHIAKHSDDGYVTVSAIAKKYDVAASLIAKVIKKLADANILKNRMGPKGGFKLTRPATQISLLEIVEAIDGPLEQMSVISEKTKQEPFMMNMETTCKYVIAKAKDVLQKTTISKMIKC